MAAVVYSGLCYILAVVTFLYAIGFVGNMFVPKSIDDGIIGPPAQALLVDIILIMLFTAQHSVMARPGFKRWWMQYVPLSVERSNYILLSSLVLILLFWQWRPLPDVIWAVPNEIVAGFFRTIFWLGWAIAIISAALIDHIDLFGLQRKYAKSQETRIELTKFRTPLFYKFVRHPIYFGFLLAFWATPVMTVAHLIFAIAMTGYIFIGIVLEERDLVEIYGDVYVQYRESVSMIVPLPPKKP